MPAPLDPEALKGMMENFGTIDTGYILLSPPKNVADINQQSLAEQSQRVRPLLEQRASFLRGFVPQIVKSATKCDFEEGMGVVNPGVTFYGEVDGRKAKVTVYGHNIPKEKMDQLKGANAASYKDGKFYRGFKHGIIPADFLKDSELEALKTRAKINIEWGDNQSESMDLTDYKNPDPHSMGPRQIRHLEWSAGRTKDDITDFVSIGEDVGGSDILNISVSRTTRKEGAEESVYFGLNSPYNGVNIEVDTPDIYCQGRLDYETGWRINIPSRSGIYSDQNKVGQFLSQYNIEPGGKKTPDILRIYDMAARAIPQQVSEPPPSSPPA